MRSKKILALSVALCLTITAGITGCSKSKATPAPAATAAAKTTGTPAAAKDDGKKFVFKLAHNLPVTHPHSVGYEKFAKLVAEKSGGRLEIKIYPSEQLGKEKDYMDSVANDSGDMGTSGPGEVAKRYKPMLIFDAPYVFRDINHMLNVSNGPVGKAMWDELATKTNLRNLYTMYYGQRYITTGKVVVKSPADMAGMKLRVPDQPMALAYGKAFGAKPTPMALGEVYLALQQGVVDGQENPIPTIISNKFNEVQKNLILTGHIKAMTSLYISEKKYQALPADLKKILDESISTIGQEISKNVENDENTKVEDLKKGGMNVIAPDIDAFKKASEPIYKEFEEQWGKGLYEKIQAVK